MRTKRPGVMAHNLRYSVGPQGETGDTQPSRARILAWAAVLIQACVTIGSGAASAAPPGLCANPDALGVSRIAVIDGAQGGIYGSITHQPHQTFLGPREVMLSFDDGPYPGLTRQIMDTLDRQCTRATFFVIGRMVKAYPDLLREEIARGHTIGTHTQNHPLNMHRLTLQANKAEIDQGFDAASAIAGEDLAPFFRFPGLGDSAAAVTYLKSRGIATFSVDLVTNDSFIRDPRTLAKLTISNLEKKDGGIILFHDIKASTAKALPFILIELKKRGFKVVHVKPKAPYDPRQAAVPEGRTGPATQVIRRSLPRPNPGAPKDAVGSGAQTPTWPEPTIIPSNETPNPVLVKPTVPRSDPNRQPAIETMRGAQIEPAKGFGGAIALTDPG